jgi:GATA-binding protein
MNLDDFLNNDNLGTPAGPEAMRQTEEKSAHSTASAIPIKSRKEPSQHPIPQSVPVAAHQRVRDEFGYLPRHQRKTSIDETSQRVSLPSSFRNEGSAWGMLPAPRAQ